jgi:hypothetical protein
LAISIDEVSLELSSCELLESFKDNPDPTRMSPQYEAAFELQKNHEASITQLRALTGELGLLRVQLPSTDLSSTEKEYLKLLIIARSQKSTLWNKISKHYDELSPLRQSRRSGGKSLLGEVTDTTCLLNYKLMTPCRYQKVSVSEERFGSSWSDSSSMCG